MISFYNEEKGLFTFYKEQIEEQNRIAKLKQQYKNRLEQSQSNKKLHKNNHHFPKKLQQSAQFIEYRKNTQAIDMYSQQLPQKKNTMKLYKHHLTQIADQQLFLNRLQKRKSNNKNSWKPIQQHQIDIPQILLRNHQNNQQYKKMKQHSLRLKSYKHSKKNRVTSNRANIPQLPNIKYRPQQIKPYQIQTNNKNSPSSKYQYPKITDYKFLKQQQFTQNMRPKISKQVDIINYGFTQCNQQVQNKQSKILLSFIQLPQEQEDIYDKIKKDTIHKSKFQI